MFGRVVKDDPDAAFLSRRETKSLTFALDVYLRSERSVYEAAEISGEPAGRVLRAYGQTCLIEFPPGTRLAFVLSAKRCTLYARQRSTCIGGYGASSINEPEPRA